VLKRPLSGPPSVDRGYSAQRRRARFRRRV